MSCSITFGESRTPSCVGPPRLPRATTAPSHPSSSATRATRIQSPPSSCDLPPAILTRWRRASCRQMCARLHWSAAWRTQWRDGFHPTPACISFNRRAMPLTAPFSLRASQLRARSLVWKQRKFRMLGAELQMASELQEAPGAVRRQAVALTGPLAALIGWSQRTRPALVVTCARGSSAHAATFAKHLFERHLGIPVAAAAPNVATIYRQRLQLKNQLLLTISQSGRSDDLTEFALMAKAAGALTAAIVNDTDSPLAAACDIVLPMAAGPELSVAATKSFVTSLAVLLRLIAEWTEDDALRTAIGGLPERLELATTLKWDEAVDPFSRAESLATIGRGPTLAIA